MNNKTKLEKIIKKLKTGKQLTLKEIGFSLYCLTLQEIKRRKDNEK